MLSSPGGRPRRTVTSIKQRAKVSDDRFEDVEESKHPRCLSSLDDEQSENDAVGPGAVKDDSDWE